MKLLKWLIGGSVLSLILWLLVGIPTYITGCLMALGIIPVW